MLWCICLQIANRHPKVTGEITLQNFEEIGQKTPLRIDLKPSGGNYMSAFHNAGGMLALLHTLRPLLHLSAMTITGQTLGEVLDAIPFRAFPSRSKLSGGYLTLCILHPRSSLCVGIRHPKGP
jgi:dihydroxy-acid dehydratase